MDEHLEELAKARLGSVLKDKWTLDELLGVGGMAAVYAATHRNKNRVAIKMLHPELSLNPEMKRRFLREGYVANSVEHEGALAVQDDDEAEDGSVFLVMELIDGEDLDERRKRFGGALPQREALDLMDQLLDVLVAAHERGVLHRDIKPENLLVDGKGKIKVLDFGIARLREMASSTTHTKTGVLLGTPAFMAPEQAASLWDDVDERSDVWAVGATLYTLLCGRMVHEAETLTQVLALAVTRQADSIAAAKPDLHPAVVELVDKALAFDKADRFQSAAEMQSALRAARESLADSPDAVAGPAPEPAPAKPRTSGGDKHPAQTTVAAVTAQQLEQQSKRASRGVIVAVVSVLIGAGIGVVMMSGEGEETSGEASAAPEPSETAPPARGKPWRAPARPSADSFEPMFGDAGAAASASASAATSATASASVSAATSAAPSATPSAGPALPTTGPKPEPGASPAPSAAATAP